MEIEENSQQDIRLVLLRLGAVNCLGVGLAMLSLSASCQLFFYECRTIDFSGYMFLGLMAVAGGIILQWCVSSGLGSFVYSLFLGLCMGVSLWGLSTLLDGLLH